MPERMYDAEDLLFACTYEYNTLLITTGPNHVIERLFIT